MSNLNTTSEQCKYAMSDQCSTSASYQRWILAGYWSRHGRQNTTFVTGAFNQNPTFIQLKPTSTQLKSNVRTTKIQTSPNQNPTSTKPKSNVQTIETHSQRPHNQIPALILVHTVCLYAKFIHSLTLAFTYSRGLSDKIFQMLSSPVYLLVCLLV